MSAVEEITTEQGEPIMAEDNTGGGNELMVDQVPFSALNNYQSVTVGNGMSVSEVIR